MSGTDGRNEAAAPTTTSTSGVGQPNRSHSPATSPTAITSATSSAVTSTTLILSVQVAHPVGGNPAGRARDRLPGRMGGRPGELGAVGELALDVVPEPALPGLEALRDPVTARGRVGRGVLVRRGIAAADVPAGGTAA